MLRKSETQYIHDPEHQNKPEGSDWHKTEKGWSTYEEEVAKAGDKDKYVFPHNAVFSFSSNLNVNFHGTTEESKSFHSRFKKALLSFKSKKNQYQEFQKKYASLLDSVVDKTKGSGNELVIYGWSVRQGKTHGMFDVEMLGIDPVHTAMIGEEIAKEFGKVEIATDTPSQTTKSIIIDKTGKATPFYGVPKNIKNQLRYTFSTNVTVDLDVNKPKGFADGFKKAIKNNFIKIRNSLKTDNNERLFISKIKQAFEKNGVKFSTGQYSISPVYGGYKDQKTQEVGTEISYDIHFKQIDPEKAIMIAKCLNQEFYQQSTLLTAYGPDKRVSFYVS